MAWRRRRGGVVDAIVVADSGKGSSVMALSMMTSAGLWGSVLVVGKIWAPKTVEACG